MDRTAKIVKYFRNNFQSVTKGLRDLEIIELALSIGFNVNKLQGV
jgi:hypothetical protein